MLPVDDSSWHTISIDTPKKVLLQTHGIKALMDLIIGGEELILSLKAAPK